MSEINPIGSPAAVGLPETGRINRVNHETETSRVEPDRADFSETAKLLSRLSSLPSVRHNLVERIRAEIASGTYETPDKIEGAIDGLNEDLG
jgi:anti-sigma28 factor (negative regulator of flagellin synthesis)